MRRPYCTYSLTSGRGIVSDTSDASAPTIPFEATSLAEATAKLSEAGFKLDIWLLSEQYNHERFVAIGLRTVPIMEASNG